MWSFVATLIDTEKDINPVNIKKKEFMLRDKVIEELEI